MTHVRYVGPLPAVDLAISGGPLRFERDVWVDIDAALEAAFIPPHHLPIVLRGLGPEWEVEVPTAKPSKPAGRKAAPETTQESPK